MSFPVAPKIKDGPDHQYEVDLGDVDHFVAFTEYPAGYFAQRDANQFLDKMVGSLTGEAGKVRLSRKISIAGNLGREYIVDKSESSKPVPTPNASSTRSASSCSSATVCQGVGSFYLH